MRNFMIGLFIGIMATLWCISFWQRKVPIQKISPGTSDLFIEVTTDNIKSFCQGIEAAGAYNHVHHYVADNGSFIVEAR